MSSWVEELRSGEHKQCVGKLKSRNGAHCCLGVLYEDLLGQPLEWVQNFREYQTPTGSSGSLPDEIAFNNRFFDPVTEEEKQTLLEIDDRFQDTEVFQEYGNNTRQQVCIDMNDELEYNFQQIADVLDELGWDVVV